MSTYIYICICIYIYIYIHKEGPLGSRVHVFRWPKRVYDMKITSTPINVGRRDLWKVSAMHCEANKDVFVYLFLDSRWQHSETCHWPYHNHDFPVPPYHVHGSEQRFFLGGGGRRLALLRFLFLQAPPPSRGHHRICNGGSKLGCAFVAAFSLQLCRVSLVLVQMQNRSKDPLVGKFVYNTFTKHERLGGWVVRAQASTRRNFNI